VLRVSPNGASTGILPSMKNLVVFQHRLLRIPSSAHSYQALQGGSIRVFRNEFHAGFQQAFGSYVVVSAEYVWKYTHNALRLQRAGQHTPLLSLINWHNSKISGPVARGERAQFP